MPVWKKVLSPMIATGRFFWSALASMTLDMPCAMLMPAPMQVLQCMASNGGRAARL